MRILVIGRDGQLAFELRRSLVCLGELVALDRQSNPPLDLADSASVRAAIRHCRPQLVVNAAAYTAVDRAEQEPDPAFRINGEAPGILAEEAAAIGASLIHYSTDYVFSGTAREPYHEDDPTDPVNVYGRSKLAGEEAIRAVGLPHLILRTAWVYGRRGHNFLLTMLRLLGEREALRVVDDQQGAPTWSRLIAQATALILARSFSPQGFEPPNGSGTYHLTCAGQTSWYGFAERIRTLAIERGLLPETAACLEPIPTSLYPTPARRPAWSVLAGDKLLKDFGIALPDWDLALALCLEE